MKKILILLLLLLIPLAQAEPLATSYWGYVSVDNTPKTNALVTVLDSSGKELAHATSLQKSEYQVTITWDDSTTQADEGVADGETITFNVDGTTVLSRTIDPKGKNIRIDLAAASSQPIVSSGAVTSSTETPGTVISNTATTSSITTSSPAVTTTRATTEAAGSPTATPDVTAATTEKKETPAAAKGAPGFGLVLAIAGLMMVLSRREGN